MDVQFSIAATLDVQFLIAANALTWDHHIDCSGLLGKLWSCSRSSFFISVFDVFRNLLHLHVGHVLCHHVRRVEFVLDLSHCDRLGLDMILKPKFIDRYVSNFA